MVTLTFQSINDANAVLVALGKFPYEQVAPLIENLRAQIQKQNDINAFREAPQCSPPSGT